MIHPHSLVRFSFFLMEKVNKKTKVELSEVGQLQDSMKTMSELMYNQFNEINKTLKTMQDCMKTMQASMNSIKKTGDNNKRNIDKLLEKSSSPSILNYLVNDMGCVFPTSGGISGRKIYYTECQEGVFEKFRTDRKKTYENSWKMHSGLDEKSTTNSEEFETDFIGICNRDNLSKDSNLLQSSPSKTFSNSIGSLSHSQSQNKPTFNTLALFEVTTKTVHFDQNYLPFTEKFKTDAATQDKKKCMMNLLEKLLQLENNLLFVKLYYGIEMEEVICGMAFPNVEANKFQELVRFVDGALDHDHFKDCVPLILRARKLEQFKII